MSGKLLVIAGFSCSGKTTYIQACHNLFKNKIQHRNFFTNRPPRTSQELANSPDYTFIKNNEYLNLLKQSDWHWVTWFGYEYGFHIPSEIKRLRNGRKIIIGAFPSTSYIKSMHKIYGSSNVISVFLDVNFTIIKNRLFNRPAHEHKRIYAFNQQQINRCAKNSDIIFTPTNNLNADRAQFLNMVKQILKL